MSVGRNWCKALGTRSCAGADVNRGHEHLTFHELPSDVLALIRSIVRLLDKTQAVLWKMIKKINFALLGAVLC